MQTAIVKWGNSQGIRLPKSFLQNINISENETVDVILEKEMIIIKKINKKTHRTTKERLLEYFGEKYDQNIISQQNEIDWGTPVGKEIW
ncbi:hypothetical protein FACS1894172_08780 [Spirochaetia bacterium]|nr:hypothetical protein FACS1894164_12300 [Spirochaetia bacterium]GHU32340.1 hypothetical protein FACS1894172_08780 [Spirochaetia bacterium]